MQSYSSRFHNNVVIDSLSAGNHRVHLFHGPAERFGKLLVIRIKALIPEGLEHVLGLFLIGSSIVNFLVEHHRLLFTVLFQITIRLQGIIGK
jgi:hypothetical protein